MKYLSMFLIILLATANLAACDVDEGPVEEAGENVDETFEDAEEATENTLDEADDTVD